MIARALLSALVLAAAPVAASAQTARVQVAPVLVAMTPERAISSIRLRNGRSRPISFEIDAFAWSQANGRDQLTPTNQLLVAPAVFEIPANGEQVVRLGVRDANGTEERAYRILLRELRDQQADGVALGFTLEMSLPVFVTPRGAGSTIQTRQVGGQLILTNSGSSYSQITLLQGDQPVPSPRYLLAGASAEITLPAHTGALRLITANGNAQNEQIIHVAGTDFHASVR